MYITWIDSNKDLFYLKTGRNKHKSQTVIKPSHRQNIKNQYKYMITIEKINENDRFN